ncbi:hypothetical protein HN587_07010 [Candidatus Woesearchaeota archaeon]|jgi:hypothetical protein|nr:hypothetical protein [Candidatus Woesearchaeota archaeon]
MAMRAKFEFTKEELKERIRLMEEFLAPLMNWEDSARFFVDSDKYPQIPWLYEYYVLLKKKQFQTRKLKDYEEIKLI